MFLIVAFVNKAQINSNLLKKIIVKKDKSEQKINISIDGNLFTSFCFPDSLEKPFLFPIIASNGATITRGFPLAPRKNEPVDHPHHIGLWMNYESVNGLDFWNNSYAIAPENKSKYGWIRTRKISNLQNGKHGSFQYDADWMNQQKQILMQETTQYYFSADTIFRIIDRVTTFTAMVNIDLSDSKDGLLGLRVAHELELPIYETKSYTDANGIKTIIKATKDSTVTGNYLTSEGKEADAAWGTRGDWCMLYGKLGTDSISIAVIDHPQNPGYPTYWHARNYGLFAANPLGQKIFSNGKKALNLKLAKGEQLTFRYRIIIAAKKSRITNSELEEQFREFEMLK